MERRQEMLQKFNKFSDQQNYDLFCLRLFSLNSNKENETKIKMVSKRQQTLYFNQ